MSATGCVATKDGFQVGQTAKARSGRRVQSLRKGHGRPQPVTQP
jgi:hypothetical protein